MPEQDSYTATLSDDVLNRVTANYTGSNIRRNNVPLAVDSSGAAAYADRGPGSEKRRGSFNVPWSAVADGIKSIPSALWRGARNVGKSAINGVGTALGDFDGAVRGLGNGAFNLLTGRGWNPTYGLFGSTLNQNGVDTSIRAADHAKSVVGGLDRFATNVNNGIWNTRDAVAGVFGAKPIAKEIINQNEDYHRRFQDSLYTDPTRPELTDMEDVAGTGIELAVGGLARRGASLGARALGSVVNTAAEAGKLEHDPLNQALMYGMFMPALVPGGAQKFVALPEFAHGVVDSSIIGSSIGHDARSRNYFSQLDQLNKDKADPNSELGKNIANEKRLRELASLISDYDLYARTRGVDPNFDFVWTDDKRDRLDTLTDELEDGWIKEYYPGFEIGDALAYGYDDRPYHAIEDRLNATRNYLAQRGRDELVGARHDGTILPILHLANKFPALKEVIRRMAAGK